MLSLPSAYDGRRLRKPVAFQDEDTYGVEESVHRAREGSAARYARDEAVAQHGLDLPEDEDIAQSPEGCEEEIRYD